jgi:ferritin-like metal-binding protein YciE
MKTLENLFLDELADMYDSERRITKALPKLIKAATSRKLQKALQHHLEEAKGHVRQIEKVFAAFDEVPNAKKCPAIVGILEEGDQIIRENKMSPSINAAIISAARKIEFYEIASYGTLRTWAGMLENERAANLLQGILDEEKETGHILNHLAFHRSNGGMREAKAATGRKTLELFG